MIIYVGKLVSYYGQKPVSVFQSRIDISLDGTLSGVLLVLKLFFKFGLFLLEFRDLIYITQVFELLIIREFRIILKIRIGFFNLSQILTIYLFTDTIFSLAWIFLSISIF